MGPVDLKNAIKHAIETLRSHSTASILAQLLIYEANLSALSKEAKITSLAEFRRIKTAHAILLEVLRDRKDCPILIIDEHDPEKRPKSEKRSKLKLVK